MVIMDSVIIGSAQQWLAGFQLLLRTSQSDDYLPMESEKERRKNLVIIIIIIIQCQCQISYRTGVISLFICVSRLAQDMWLSFQRAHRERYQLCCASFFFGANCCARKQISAVQQRKGTRHRHSIHQVMTNINYSSITYICEVVHIGQRMRKRDTRQVSFQPHQRNCLETAWWGW